MASAAALNPLSPPRMLAAVIAALLLAATMLSLSGMLAVLPASEWWRALISPGTDVAALVFSEMVVPRIVVCWLVGAGLGLAAVLLQHVLQNPLADTTTLGVSSGAYLALAACSVFAPGLLGYGQEWIALAGAAGAAAIIMAVSARMGFSPTSVILTGLAITLLCGSAGAALAILNHEILSGLFVWQSGSLVQNGWGNAAYLLPRMGLCIAVILLMRRSLSTLELGDAQARSLGAPVNLLRGGAMAIAVALGAFCVSAVGVIGFVGLAAANLARLMGARTLDQRLVWAPVVGALLLWTTDGLVQHVSLFRSQLPTGSATALLGAPLLLWLLARRRVLGPVTVAPNDMVLRLPNPRGMIFPFVVVLCVFLLLALMWGRGVGGWQWASPDILALRAPRVAAAGAAGALLAVAGLLLQRMTANPMASPELLGISSGAALGVILLFFAAPAFTQGAMTASAVAGAAAALAAILAFNGRSAAPGRLLLAGMALATVFSAFAATLLTSGDPRAAVLLAWMSGSTYRVTGTDAIVGLASAALVLAAAPFTARWLDILPLGTAASQAVGMPITRARLILLLIIAFATAVATLIIGPLSFVGLIAPHMVRSLGVTRPLPQLFAGAIVGACLLVAADWFGRTLIFPWQIPAGIVSALIGGPIFLWLMGRRG
ncbi:Fe(3+)-hydroxamate ABC transporter permease FhuB [Aquabacter sp. CN5-332]|uniref:Fe(3+)-hydroxamate ABC transporter permease FhuB n=1 Tax=Aquabacter sp. CN5-332 TaxID=3156608 RepID=UPI0032B50428